MRYIFILFSLSTLFACASNKVVYWCGDHPCINKKERESYFKKTMIVESKIISKNEKDKSEIDKIIEQAKIKQKKTLNEEKKLAKQAKLDKKLRKEEEKRLARRVKSEKKRRIEEEKRLTKQAKLDKQLRKEEEKRLAKQTKDNKKLSTEDEKELVNDIILEENRILTEEKIKETKKVVQIINQVKTFEVKSGDFNDLVDRIKNKNTYRKYPNINDIPK